MKLVLFITPLSGRRPWPGLETDHDFTHSRGIGCREQACRITCNRNYLIKSDAVLLHGSDLPTVSHMMQIKKRKLAQQRWYVPLNHNIVPVVMGGASYKDEQLAIPGSFIDVANFQSVDALVKYLLYLDSNDTAYNEYFHWRKEFKLSFPESWTCKVCAALHNDTLPAKVYNLDEFWGVAKSCGKNEDKIRKFIATSPSLHMPTSPRPLSPLSPVPASPSQAKISSSTIGRTVPFYSAVRGRHRTVLAVCLFSRETRTRVFWFRF